MIVSFLNVKPLMCMVVIFGAPISPRMCIFQCGTLTIGSDVIGLYRGVLTEGQNGSYETDPYGLGEPAA
jgi:hypothetical protein